MLAARVIDNIWATRKDTALTGLKFMLVELLDGSNSRKIIVADLIGAGIGERVLVSQGGAARRMLRDDSIPVDAVIVGIIDEDCVFWFKY